MPNSLRDLVERYYGAYNDHDLDGILALQAPDSIYRVHGVGQPTEWRGAEACRAIYEHHLRVMPDQRLAVKSVAIADDLCVCHIVVAGTLALPWDMAGRRYEAVGAPISFEIAHVMLCEDNLVKVKEGWIDGLAIHNQLHDLGR